METKHIHEKIEKDLELINSEEVILHGMVVGDVRIKDNANFILHGMITGNLIIEKQGISIIHGTVCGYVTNNGGKLTHYGTINGRLNKVSGETYVDEKAFVMRQ